MNRPTLAKYLACILLALAPIPSVAMVRETPGFARAVMLAEKALDEGDWDEARDQIRRAQERDPRSIPSWELRARWAEGIEDRDELVYALHRKLALSVAQKRSKEELREQREMLLEIDPIAGEFLNLKERFLDKLLPLAEKYEADGRPHSAIGVHKEILALDPEREESQLAIERIASAPDPSLAADAKPKDLLADVSVEWIAEHDAEHSTWDTRAKLERENYTTHTNAGYEVLVRCAEAMEQMNAFYRVFFQYATEEDGGSVPRIALHIFKERDEYLTLGIGPPVEWSGGHFTGNAVETYVGDGGFEASVGTLFHEAAHQFVSLATSAAGWLNEGLASFFEGCRILPNGTVLMNMPATGRLFPLADRMEQGWMTDAWDGIDRDRPSEGSPEKAPTFRIVLENEYPWGPPWYAPTWGVVYFLYNYQDPIDGRFLYRNAFREFIDKSGGRVGKGAVKNFEEVVLHNPTPPTKGVEFPEDVEPVALPETVEELDAVWKEWMLSLRDEQSGRVAVERPYHDWAMYAIARGHIDDAIEHFEKGLLQNPGDALLLVDFGDLLVEERQNNDRASKLYLGAARIIEHLEPIDEKLLAAVDRKLKKVDPKRKTLQRIRADLGLAAESIAQGYLAEELNLMGMDVSWRMGNEFDFPELFEYFEEGARRSKKSLALWSLAYNEEDLEGWASAGNDFFRSDGEHLASEFGEFDESDFQYRFLTLDQVTSGDFSMEAELQAEYGQLTYGGIVFGRKSATDFHALLLYPPGHSADGGEKSGFVDLASFYGDSSFDTWRHSPIPREEDRASRSERWFKLRVDVTGRTVDVWLDDEYVASQEFASLDVLRGNFGLIVGTGKTRFRNVRYLAREARDPGSIIERELRMEDIAPAGEARAGSYQGMKPPFPKIKRWAQGERTDWDEARLKPQLVVLWSIEQNEQIKLDGWLTWLAEAYEPFGLEVLSIVSTWNDGDVDAYLQENPFPGAVGVDRITEEAGFGDSFELFFVPRFNLPRLLLLDVDGTVAWEGDPGFKVGTEWKPADGESYVRAPLDDLIAKRKLKEFALWRERWRSIGKPALERGDFEAALPLLVESGDYDWKLDRTVFEAQSCLKSVESAVDTLEATAEELTSLRCEPALVTLLEWAELLELPVPQRESNAIKKFLKSSEAKAWRKALGALTPIRKKMEAGKEIGSVESVAARLERQDGLFAQTLAEELRAANGDSEVQKVVNRAPGLPGRWLAARLFGW